MPSNFSTLVGASLIASGLMFGSAAAVEPLSTEELRTHCDGFEGTIQSADQRKCVRYIQGFIDGAVATDERVVFNMEQEMTQEKESFAERAARTRLGTLTLQARAARYAEFCLGEPVPFREVAEKVVTDLYNPEEAQSHALARDLVYASLRKYYPCQPETSETSE